MERPFLPFNDYLGLSSMFQQDLSNQEPEPEKQSFTAVPPTSQSSIDQQIEEILHQYSLKLSQQKKHSNANLSTSANRTYPLSNRCYNNSIASLFSTSHSDANNSTFSMFNSTGSNATFSSPSQVSRINSLSNSPMSPSLHFDSPPPLTPWLNSAPSPASLSISSSLGLQSQFSTSNSGISTNAVESSTLHRLASDMPSLNVIPNDPQASLIKQTNQRQPRRSTVGCSFCRNNKEVDDWVMSHQLKDSLNRVLCPILRSYMCPLCFASGDNAHTLGHCPLNPDKRNSSLPLAVRRRTNATGRVKL